MISFSATIFKYQYDCKLNNLMCIYIFSNYNIVIATRGYE